MEVAATESDVLHEQLAALRAAVAARDRFIAAVGHELRTTIVPLTVLANSLTQAADAATIERRTQMLAGSLERLTETLDRVTDVADLRSERLVLALEDVDMAAIVREVVTECRAAAAAAKVELRVSSTSVANGTWDRSRIRQIARHLIANAIRHTGGGPVDIHVESSDTHVVLTVADRGRGIPANRRASVFNAFDLAGPKASGGLGVGLWIVYTLCQHFKGAVSLVEEHDPGACFRVVLPRA